MFETFRSIRFHLLLAALGYIAVGAVMLFIPDQFLAVVCYVIGALLIAYGVIGMLMCWKDRTIRMDLQRHFGFPCAVSHESCAIDL